MIEEQIRVYPRPTIAGSSAHSCSSRRAVGSAVGIGGIAGAVGGMMIARVVGEILERTGSYVPIFIIAASGSVLV